MKTNRNNINPHWIVFLALVALVLQAYPSQIKCCPPLPRGMGRWQLRSMSMEPSG